MITHETLDIIRTQMVTNHKHSEPFVSSPILIDTSILTRSVWTVNIYTFWKKNINNNNNKKLNNQAFNVFLKQKQTLSRNVFEIESD